MHWPSPERRVSRWHLECSTMGEKYLGEKFDIHGGGLDLMFPTMNVNRAERGGSGTRSRQLLIHNNMITIEGKRWVNHITTSSRSNNSSKAVIRF